MFADFKDFVHLTETLEPASLLEELNQHFARFDQIVEGNRLEVLKTIGDAYMCVGGLPDPNRTHAIDAWQRPTVALQPRTGFDFATQRGAFDLLWRQFAVSREMRSCKVAVA